MPLPHLRVPITNTITITSFIITIEPVGGPNARDRPLRALGEPIRLVAMPPTTEQPSPFIERSSLRFVPRGSEQKDCLMMTIEEKRAMKAACVQAAATLIAARASGGDQIDVEECVKLAALLYVRVVTADWREPA